MASRSLVLASASPARLALLRAARFAPQVMVSGVAEDGLDGLGADEMVRTLAERKARAVAARIAIGAARTLTAAAPGCGPDPSAARPNAAGDAAHPVAPGRDSVPTIAASDAVPLLAGGGSDPSVDTRDSAPLVVGCDSVLAISGELRGKPASVEQARAWCRQQRGRSGTLVTGQAVVDVASGAQASGVARTVVRFGWLSDNEIDAYVATGEPLEVAGGFTIDGYAAPFVEGIDGDHGTVLGLSLPLLRTLLADIGVAISDLWVTAR